MEPEKNELESIGFRVIERLYDGKAHRVYRAVEIAPGGNPAPEQERSVIIKIRNPLYSYEGGVDRLQHEFSFGKLLRGVPDVVKYLSLHGVGPWQYLMIEDFPGEQISIYWSRRKVELRMFLECAVRITRIMGEIHRRDIIHKDISPENILINPKTKEIKIIDFSIAARVQRETRTAVSLKNIEGTPAYMSPEQTGRMNRSIDYRSDFYSLGATLYEILTGRPPFDTRDLVNLVHSHMAIQPVPPEDVKSEIPPALSNIIMKLLSKNAEDRYQSAAGLEADLRECHSRLTETGIVRGDFEIGKHDVSEKFYIPEKLYGREEEIETLFFEFNEAAAGGARMMFFKGPPGIGKSFLINEIQKPLTREKGYFASGKCEQYRRDVPAGVFIQAFQDLISQILSASDERLETWKQDILNGVGDHGQLIVQIVPELERVIGPQPPVPELPSTEKQNQYQRVFRDFVKALASTEHPLVLFLDDLQWVDNASLTLLKMLFADKTLSSILLIGAYRDTEVSGSHPLNEFVKDRKTVALGPLEVDDIRLMIEETLASERRDVARLAELVGNKTHGNPFFVKQFLLNLYMKDLLTFVLPRKGRPGWRFNIDRIQQADITDNVVKLMTQRVNLLSTHERKLLKIASCIGVWFDVEILSMLVENKTPELIFNELLTPINDGMIVKIEEKLKFAHDRVQEAVYNLLDEEERTEIHYKLGRGLLGKLDAPEMEDRIFEVVRHLNLSTSLIESEEEKIELARLNLVAGRKGKNSTAYEEARQFFKQGVELLPGDAWTRCYDLSLAMYTGGGDVCYLTGRDKEGETFFRVVLDNYRTTLDTVDIYETQISYYAVSDRPRKALRLARESLKLLEFEMPEEITGEVIQKEIESINRNMEGKEVESLEYHSELKDPKMIAAFRIIMTSAPAAYFEDRDTFVHTMLKLTSMSVIHGNSEYSPYAYAAYGIILAGKFEYFDLARRFGQLAVNLISAPGNPLRSKVFFINGYFIRHWKSHYRRSLKFLLNAFKAGVSSGDHQYASFGLEHYMIGLFLTGENLDDVKRQYEKYADGIKSLHMTASTAEYEFCRQTFESLCEGSGDGAFIEKLLADEFDFYKEMKELGNKTYLGHYFVLKQIYLCLFGRFKEALETARICEESQCMEALLSSKYTVEHNFYQSLSLLDLCHDADEKTRRKHLARVDENQKRMKYWTRHAPMNYKHKFLLVEAERKALHEESRQSLDVLKLYDRAVESAERHGFIHVQGIALERAARFCRSHSLDNIAGYYLNQALLTYRKWGAALKVNKLEETHQELNPAVSATADFTSTIGGTDSVDLTTVARASHAISGELVVKDLMSELINIVIQNAGAKRAFLILEKEGELFIEARRSAGDKEALVESLPLEGCEELALTVVKFVQRTREIVVLGNAARDRRFAKDPYIDRMASKSILCFPLISQKKLKAVIYLENDLLNAFRKESLYIITLLSSQAAIALELFDKQRRVEESLHKKVMERTRELRETQANLIQQAHVSGMAEMAVGILHNIGNAITPAIIGADLLLKQLDNSQSTFHLTQAMGQLQGVVREAADVADREKKRLVQIMNLLPENIRMEYEGFREQVRRIRGKHEHIRNIIRLQMRYARLAGDYEEVDINRVVEDALEMLNEAIEKRAVRVRKEFTDPLPKVRIEQAKLIQIIVNIIKNAYEAMSKVRGREKLLTIVTYVDDDAPPQVGVSFRDTGVGITPEQKKDIFKFAYSTKERGSGFGLHSCANYLIANKGSIVALSDGRGRGAEFILRLPASQEEEK